jgi:WD40 repeat protein
MNKYQYQIGGSLPIDSPTYVIRQGDQQLYQGLKHGDFCYIFNSPQTGKTSLKIRTIQRLQGIGIRCVSIDLQSIGTSDLTSEEWYAGIIDHIVRGLELYNYFDLESWWHEFQRLSNIHRLSKFLEEILLNLIPDNIVIFIDEIESIFALDFKVEDFFALIREFNNKKNHSVTHQRLTFALFGVASVYDLVKNQKISPFSQGKSIPLTGFTSGEVYPLLEGIKDKSNNPEKLLESILFWTGGQPFLTQKLCNLVANFSGFIPVDNGVQSLEEIVRSQIIKNWQTQDEPEHLKVICDRLLFSEKSLGKSLEIYQKILEKGTVEKNNSFEQIELNLSGLVVIQNNQLMVYNPIYLAVFNPQWVAQELENLRPYSQAIIAWLASNRLDISRLLRGQALQDALQWSKGKNLSYQDYQFLDASQEYEIQQAKEILELKQKAIEAEQLKIETKRNQKSLETIETQNKNLQQLQENSLKIIKFRTIILLISLISSFPLISFLILGNKERFLLKTQQSLTQASQKFEFAQIDALISAMEVGQDFQNVYQNKTTFGKNPINTPMFVLRPILDNIQEKNQLKSHEDTITALDFSGDGRYLISASSDTIVKIWDLQNSQYINLNNHQDKVTGIALSPDNQYIATASLDKTVKIWNLQGNLLKNITDYQEGVMAVSFSPDGQYLATASADNLIKIWDLQGNLYKSFSAHEGIINAINFSGDGKYLVTASDDNNAIIWDLQGNFINSFKQDKAILNAKFSKDNTHIITISSDNTAKFWDIFTKESVSFRGHTAPIRGVDFSPDGTKIATASEDLTTKIWDLQGNLIQELKGHQDQVITVAFSADGEMLATGSKDRSIRLWSLKQKDQPLIFKGHENGLNSVAFSPDGTKIATTSQDKTLRLWDLEGRQTRKITHPDGVTSVAFSPDGEYFLSGCEDGIMRLWNREAQMLKEFKGHNGGILSIKISANGEKILTTSKDKTAILWDIQGTIIQRLIGHEGMVYEGDFSPDGKYIVTVSEDGTTRLWDENGNFQKILTKNNVTVKTVKFSPEGKIIATGAFDGITRLVNLQGKIIKEIKGHYSPINRVNFSPDGKMIATASFDGMTRLWNLNGDGLVELRGHEGEITDVVFHPLYSKDQPYLITVSQDLSARLWRGENLDVLLNRGCNWLDGYFVNNPETLARLKVCR